MTINEGIRVQEVETCQFCGVGGLPLYNEMRDRLYTAPGVWSFLSCPNCEYIWLNPRPVPEDIGSLYDTYFTHLIDKKIPRSALLRVKEKIKILLISACFNYESPYNGRIYWWMGKTLGLISPLRELAGSSVSWLEGSRKGKLLDIGCGSGRYLNLMKGLGWNVFGVEPDAKASKVAMDRFRIQVLNSTMEEANLPENFYDAVTMNHVIEHVYDPNELLQECLRVLKPGGRLIVITPNVGSQGHKVFQESWLHLDPPRHFQLFSLETLKNSVERAGLLIDCLHTTARSARGIWVTSKLIRRDGKLTVGSPRNSGWSLRLEGIAFQLLQYGLAPFRRNRKIGEEIVLIASKGKHGPT